MGSRRLCSTCVTFFMLTFTFPSLVLAAKPGANTSVPNTGTISGTVSLDGKPVSGLVFIPGKSFIAKTDSSGSYTLYYVPVGQQSVMIEIPGNIPFSVGGCDLTTNGCTVSKNLACLPGEQRICVDCASLKETCSGTGTWPGCSCPGNCTGDARLGLPCDGPDADLCATGVWNCDANGLLACIGDQPRQEICDGVDNDCNGLVDEGDLCGVGNVCVQGACQPAP